MSLISTNIYNNKINNKYDEFDSMIKELSILSKKCLNNGKYVKLSELDTIRFKCICEQNYTGLFCETSKIILTKFISLRKIIFIFWLFRFKFKKED